MIMTNGSEKNPQGTGYLIDRWPEVHNTVYRAARDMWLLLGPRIKNLEDHGIRNEKIRSLFKEGEQALKEADQALRARRYDRQAELAARSWGFGRPRLQPRG